MAPKIYGPDMSPAVRSVLLVSKTAGIDIETIPVNLAAGEHLKPEFLKMNPQHTVPTMDDNGFYIWDSHAISTYLIQKYGKDDSLYPKDLQKRAVIDQRLHFDSGTLFPRAVAIIRPIIREGVTSISIEKTDSIEEAYQFLEEFLNRSTYMACDALTLADLCLVTTISSANIVVPISATKYPKLTAWFKRMQTLPSYKEGNQVGLDKFSGFIKSKMQA